MDGILNVSSIAVAFGSGKGFPSDESEGEETMITIKTHFADDEVKILVKTSTKAKIKLANARFLHLRFCDN